MSLCRKITALLITFLIANFLIVPFALAERPRARVPDRLDSVLERLPKGYAALSADRSNSRPSLALIEQLLNTAASTGDSRLAARADGLLQKFPASESSPALLRLRAFSAQHRHDFALSLELLDTLVEQQPRDGDARLARAQIHLVQGRLDRARSDCAALVFGVDAGNGLLCASSLALRSGQLRDAADLADRWLANAASDDQGRRYVLILRAEIASRAGDADADRYFRSALALAPADVRSLAAYARHLRANERHREIVALLSGRESDGLCLQRALAADIVKDARAAAMAKALASNYQLLHRLGSEPELRDEAEFQLSLRGDAMAALALAQRNFETQRDYEDVDLLRRAAAAAHRPEALVPLRAWAQSQRLQLAPLAGTSP